MSDNLTFGMKSKINWQIVFFVALFGMIAVSSYMVSHYFDFHYGAGLEGSICDLNSIFNCDLTTSSPLSNILGVPVGVFALGLCAFLLAGYMFESKKMESTNHFLSILNLVGCLVLFGYSLIALGGLCPMCMGYYFFSALMFFVFHKNSTSKLPDLLTLGAYAVVTLLIAYPVYSNVKERSQKDSQYANALIAEYKKLKKYPLPEKESPYKLAVSTEKFADAPIRLAIFSDYQCPACGALAAVIPKLVSKYKGKINIDYFFYPLDADCNSDVKVNRHPFACKGAYLSACLKDDFLKVHDDIFEHQRDLSLEWFTEYAEKRNVLECYKNPKTKEEVQNFVALSKPFHIRSTPTILVNETKIAGSLPLKAFTALFDHLIANE